MFTKNVKFTLSHIKQKAKSKSVVFKGVVDQISLKINDAMYDYPLASNGHT